MAMHRNFYWHRMLLEDCGTGQPCVETALAELRSFIYRMVLNHSDDKVVEYGRAPYEKFKCTMVGYELEWLLIAWRNYIFLNSLSSCSILLVMEEFVCHKFIFVYRGKWQH